MKITNTPPTTSSTGMIGRILRIPRITEPSARPVIRNGTPSPIDQALKRNAPCSTEPHALALVPAAPALSAAASIRIEPRIGPMHGVQPTANAEPMPNDFP